MYIKLPEKASCTGNGVKKNGFDCSRVDKKGPLYICWPPQGLTVRERRIYN